MLLCAHLAADMQAVSAGAAGSARHPTIVLHGHNMTTSHVRAAVMRPRVRLGCYAQSSTGTASYHRPSLAVHSLSACPWGRVACKWCGTDRCGLRIHQQFAFHTVCYSSAHLDPFTPNVHWYAFQNARLCMQCMFLPSGTRQQYVILSLTSRCLTALPCAVSFTVFAVTVAAPEPTNTVVAATTADPVSVDESAAPADIIEAAPADSTAAVPAVAEPEPPKFVSVKQLQLRSAAAYLPHVNKESYGGEDAHFISNVSGGAIGVADGKASPIPLSLIQASYHIWSKDHRCALTSQAVCIWGLGMPEYGSVV